MPADYVRAVERAGGRALLVPPSEDGVEETLDALDGIVFSGGSDLDPATYGQDRHEATDGIVEERDRAELALLQAALARDMPVLGDLPRLAAAERRPRRRPRPAPARSGRGREAQGAAGRVLRARRRDRAGDEARRAARRARAGQVAPPPGLRAASARACASRRAPRTARSRRSKIHRAASRSACSGTRRPGRTCGCSRRSSARRRTTARPVERPRRARPDAAGPGPRGAPQRRLDLRPRHLGRSPAAGLPDPRRAEGRHDRALLVPAPAPVDHRALVEGGQLLRPPLRARRGVVPRQLPEQGAHARQARRRGEPELPLPPAGTAARARRCSRRRDSSRSSANPVDRALSHYNHEVALGREPLSFEDALAAEDERLRGEVERLVADPRYFSREWWSHTYKARGRYAEQLERWLEVFPREQLLVVPSDDLAADPAGDARAGARLPRRAAAAARVVPARLRARVRADAAGDARSARRRVRGAEPAALRAARPRARLELTRRRTAGRPRLTRQTVASRR